MNILDQDLEESIETVETVETVKIVFVFSENMYKLDSRKLG